MGKVLNIQSVNFCINFSDPFHFEPFTNLWICTKMVNHGLEDHVIESFQVEPRVALLLPIPSAHQEMCSYMEEVDLAI